MMTTDDIPLWILTIPLILWGVAIYIVSYIVWRKNKRTTALVAPLSNQRFSDLMVSSMSNADLGISMGLAVKAQVYLLGDHIVITSQKMSLKLFHTTLPIVLENKKGTIKKVVTTSWKTVQITCLKNTFSLGKATVEVIIETKDTDEQIAIFNHIKDWT